MVRGKSALSNDARIHLANFLRCNGEVPLASNARAAAMRERARERLATEPRLGTVDEREAARSSVCDLCT